MKYLFILTLLVLCSSLKAQERRPVDSTEIKLQQYKHLYDQGLITSEEYRAMREKLLGVKIQAPTATQSPAGETRNLSPAELDRWRKDAQRRTTWGIVLTSAGALSLGGGLYFLFTANFPGYIILFPLGIFLDIMGPIQLARGLKSMHRYYKYQAGLLSWKVSGNGVGMAYTF